MNIRALLLFSFNPYHATCGHRSVSALPFIAAPGEENGERRILWEWNQKRASVL